MPVAFCAWLLCSSLFAAAAGCAPAWALTPEQALRIAAGDSDDRIAALNEVVAAADPALAAFVQALLADEVKVAGGKAFIVRDGKAVDAATGAAATLPDDAEDVVNNNRMRARAARPRWPRCKLFSPDRAARAKAHRRAEGPGRRRQAAADREGRWRPRPTPALKAQLALLRAAVLIVVDRQGQAPGRRASCWPAAASRATRALLLERLARRRDRRRGARPRCSASLDSVQSRLAWGERLGVLFTGVSLGSILLLVALGLAITYGLMGVINMAHGELMMIGAYATYVVQNLFRQLPARRLRLVHRWRPSRSASWPRRWSARCWSAASSAGSTAGRWKRCWPPGASA